MRQQAKAFGCNTNSMFGRAPQCAGIEARLRRASGSADGRTIRRLQAEVNRACATRTVVREPQRVVREPRRQATSPGGGVIIHGTREDNRLDARARRGNFLSRLFGAQEDEVIVETVRADPAARTTTVERHNLDGERPRRDVGPGEVRSLATGSGGSRQLREGGYRTMCVRLCDGFYFPINSRSHSDNFYEELAMCVGRCPGADVSLYVHDANGAVEGMRSAMTGEPYVRLPTAFVYRKSLVPNCGCEPQTVIAADQTADKALSYVGAGGTGAEAAAEAAAAPGGWTPLKAVYDATGEPLDLSIGVEQVAKPRAAEPAATPVAASSIPAVSAPANGSEPSQVRTVGGQFFSDAPTAAETQGLGLPRRLLPAAAGAVKIVPLSPETSAIDEPAAASDAPTETSEAPAPVNPGEAAAATGATSTASVGRGRGAIATPVAASTDG